jgi:hypothetical protein
MDQLREQEMAGETKVFGYNLYQSHFAHHKSHMPTAVGRRGLTASAMTRPSILHGEIRFLFNSGFIAWRTSKYVLNDADSKLIRHL